MHYPEQPGLFFSRFLFRPIKRASVFIAPQHHQPSSRSHLLAATGYCTVLYCRSDKPSQAIICFVRSYSPVRMHFIETQAIPTGREGASQGGMNAVPCPYLVPASASASLPEEKSLLYSRVPDPDHVLLEMLPLRHHIAVSNWPVWGSQTPD
jgi:hypothetical protein